MSTEYPEVSGDESGIVPPQSARTSEWPKKLRTLTAAELDRLTIDNAGRFYWDGKLVNYDTGAKQLSDNTTDPLDRSMDILDRAAFDLGARPAQNTIEGELASLDLSPRRSEPSAIDFDIARVQDAVRHRICERASVSQRRADAPRLDALADGRRRHRGARHRRRRNRHGDLWLCRGRRMGLQDAHCARRMPGACRGTAPPDIPA